MMLVHRQNTLQHLFGAQRIHLFLTDSATAYNILKCSETEQVNTSCGSSSLTR